MLIPSEFWVKAYLRRCAADGAMAVVVNHGDDRAGAIFIKISRLDGTAELFAPAPSGFDAEPGARRFIPALNEVRVSEGEAEAYLARQRAFDSDIWIVEVEDRKGRHRLEDWLASL